jgi:hypothetical protein
MSTCYEFAFTCDLKHDVSNEVIDTLRYMTRLEEENSNFKTSLKHSLFTTSKDVSFEGIDYLADWKIIISNDPDEGEQLLPGTFGSIFRGCKLTVRKFVGDDEFHNTFHLLMDWLVSVCESDGFIGYYYPLRNLSRNTDPILLYFIDGQVFEKEIEGKLKILFE